MRIYARRGAEHRLRRYWTLTVYRWFLVLLFACAGSGCAAISFNPWKTAGTTEKSPAALPEIQITYSTDSGRLNQQVTGRGETQLASLAASEAMAVPPFTRGTLTIRYPHPRGVPGVALATATFSPAGNTADPGSLASLWKGGGSGPVSSANAREVWEAEIPEQHVAGLVAQLKEKQFFRRVKILGAESQMEATINGKTTSKAFLAMSDLDAMLVNIRARGRREGSRDVPGSSDRMTRLPAESAGQFWPAEAF